MDKGLGAQLGQDEGRRPIDTPHSPLKAERHAVGHLELAHKGRVKGHGVGNLSLGPRLKRGQNLRGYLQQRRLPHRLLVGGHKFFFCIAIL
jgi:hypothetical protein